MSRGGAGRIGGGGAGRAGPLRLCWGWDRGCRVGAGRGNVSLQDVRVFNHCKRADTSHFSWSLCRIFQFKLKV